MIRVGSLFSGAGALDMVVRQALGAEPVWFVESDPAAARALAHHWPVIPNHGDVTAVGFSAVESVEVLTGGSVGGPVNPGPWRANAEERLMSARCGPRWPEPSVTWPRSGTWDRGAAYELPRSAPLIDGTECLSSPGLLPTPTARDADRGAGWGDEPGRPLSETVHRLLPTPRASDGTKGGPNQRGSSGDLMLSSVVTRLPPTSTATRCLA